MKIVPARWDANTRPSAASNGSRSGSRSSKGRALQPGAQFRDGAVELRSLVGEVIAPPDPHRQQVAGVLLHHFEAEPRRKMAGELRRASAGQAVDAQRPSYWRAGPGQPLAELRKIHRAIDQCRIEIVTVALVIRLGSASNGLLSLPRRKRVNGVSSRTTCCKSMVVANRGPRPARRNDLLQPGTKNAAISSARTRLGSSPRGTAPANWSFRGATARPEIHVRLCWRRRADTFLKGPCSWIPGPALTGRPGMTTGMFVMPYSVYLLASSRYGTLYLGMTNDLVRRVHEHKAKAIAGFTAKYGVDRLVWFELYDEPTAAITREKAVKKWRRDWKIRLIEEQNPEWRDLFPAIVG